MAVKIILNRAKQYFIKFGFQLYTASDINSITIGKHTGIDRCWQICGRALENGRFGALKYILEIISLGFLSRKKWRLGLEENSYKNYRT